MAENPKPAQGPPMICATSAIRIGPTRIGHLFGKVTLPRTVAVTTLLAVAAGVAAGLLLAMMVPGGGIQRFTYGGALGGTAGWFITSFSPLQGESLLSWVRLQLATLRRQRLIGGRAVLLSVGVAPARREAVGRIQLNRSAVQVSAGSFDDRGVLIARRTAPSAEAVRTLDADAARTAATRRPREPLRPLSRSAAPPPSQRSETPQ